MLRYAKYTPRVQKILSLQSNMTVKQPQMGLQEYSKMIDSKVCSQNCETDCISLQIALNMKSLSRKLSRSIPHASNTK